MKPEQSRIIAAFLRHCTRMAIPCEQVSAARAPDPAVAAERLTIAAQDVQVQIKKLPTVGERLVEVLALHHLRHLSIPQPAHLLIVHVERLPGADSRWLDELTRITKATRHPANWAVISGAGGAILQLPMARRARDMHPDDAAGTTRAGSHTALHQLTDIHSSDVAMAILKIALLKAATNDLISWKVVNAWPTGGKRMQQIDLSTITTIAGLAGHLAVSKSAIYAVHNALIERGWIVARRGQCAEITDIPSVVAWWIDQRKHRRSRTLAVAPLYEAPARTHKAALTWLRARALVESAPWALTGWAACHLNRRCVLDDPSRKPVVVVVRGPVHQLRQAWSLVEVPPERALFHLQSSPSPTSTFAMTTEIRGLPCVDLWEASLDVAGDPQRGIEQTQAIAEILFASAP